ncbi:hypothetical protein FHR24_000250 [Wenyingzhuangia heitensis]|uniref:Uncharacterized protein n=1 Tax=Wenyingzhuangia heitensis TaxID=1487859 RepID=A0ABX0U8H4_9FLAO|nr:hypothetical protein [Wenyingzhuangia heitensis]NIJ43811.1 hypothetical protein [Wenyingzhuangia heitensis]
MKSNLKRINEIFKNDFIDNISLINRKLYPRPYLFDEETSEEDEPILFI